jgi:hypothetical protein
MAESVGSSPNDANLHVTTWFDEHFVLTDGAFTAAKSAYQKRHLTVTNLETLYEHFKFHALSLGVPIPTKLTFAYILQNNRGVRYKFIKNRWVGAIKRAANVHPKRPSSGPGDALLAYRHLQAQARAIQAVAPDAPELLSPALFEEFRHVEA